MDRFEPLERGFYRPSAKVVAPGLLGHWLIHRTSEGVCGGMIVETEAYLADDPACHAYRGESARNRAMFQEGGCAYVYLIYGMHFCFNTVCGPKGVGEAVLVRAVEARFGLLEMERRRGPSRPEALTNGPAKLCEALAIDRKQDGADLCKEDARLIVALNPDRDRILRKLGPVVTTTRIGISQAADWPLRFYLQNSSFVSRKVR